MENLTASALSPDARGVYDSFNRVALYNEPSFETDRKALAAALRAAAEKIEDLYCDSDIDDSDGVVFALRQLMLIADELEGA